MGKIEVRMREPTGTKAVEKVGMWVIKQDKASRQKTRARS
jgi:hypothetical protein